MFPVCVRNSGEELGAMVAVAGEERGILEDGLV